MLKHITLLLLLLTLAACGRGWSQGDRDKLTQSCVQKAQASGAGIDETKLKNYCSCYQQNLEKKFPTMGELIKASPDAITQEAKNCLPLMIK